VVQSETVTLLATCEVRIDASPETVFGFLVDPEKMVRWMGMAVDADATPGGRYDVAVTPTFHAVGEFRSIDAPRSVSFTWGYDGGPLPPGSSLVTITLTPEGDGTLVKLEHSGLPDEAQVRGHTEGWVHYLERLSIVASGGDPGVDPWTQR
jgi:uncharacterized protein YndB with AHSA1/START domain